MKSKSLSRLGKDSLFLAVLYMIATIFRTIPLRVTAGMLISLVSSLMMVLATWALQFFLDAVTDLAAGSSLTPAFTGLAVLALVRIIGEVLGGLDNFQIGTVTRILSGQLLYALNNKAARIARIHYESPDFLDTLNKAKTGITVGSIAALTFINLFTFYIPYFIFMAIFLRILSPRLLLLLFLVFIPVMLGQFWRYRSHARAQDQAAPARREIEHHEKALCDREWLKETRQLGAFVYFFPKYRQSLSRLNQLTLKAEVQSSQSELAFRILTVLGYVGILGIILTELLTGKISLGSFSAVFAAVGMMYSLANEIVSGRIGEIARDIGTLRHFRGL